MATILRDLSYRYQWLYDNISRVAALAVGGEGRFRQLALQDFDWQPETRVLDLCCGWGQTTALLVERSNCVTGLDASPKALARARSAVPQATYVEAFAEAMPFPDGSFEVVHSSAAMHEMEAEQLRQIFQEVHRVLVPGGCFLFSDFHAPTNPLFWPGVAAFFWLFETETAWEFVQTDVPGLLESIGFCDVSQAFYAGGSVQVLRAKRATS
ncbi:class I SAM-dependent methyltransferase [Limnothrix redekei]|uniref:Class I SAM-dependent methyltransferase n=1 Tax=Limnothrix redekei LRLZ20PSL1 TaxID=3112953 RepID=A0ABW7C6H7_9CYAN